MSIGRAVREKTIELLANGLNAHWYEILQRNQLSVPKVATGGNPSQPFTFSGPNANVKRVRANMDTFAGIAGDQQYPYLFVSVRSAIQDSRIMAATPFFGIVTIDLLFYLGWFKNDRPKDDDFESQLDALEEAVILTLNGPHALWHPVVYNADLNVRNRSDLQLVNNSQVYRRSMAMDLSARILQA